MMTVSLFFYQLVNSKQVILKVSFWKNRIKSFVLEKPKVYESLRLLFLIRRMFAICCKIDILKLSKNKIINKVIEVEYAVTFYEVATFLFYKSKTKN